MDRALAEKLDLDDRVVHRAGNLALLVLCSLLVYLLVVELLTHWNREKDRKKERNRALGLACAALFLIHPISGVTVNYLAARDLLLMEFFFLAFFLIYVRMRRMGDSAGAWTLALALLALSLLSKTNAVVAPALVLVFELFLGGRSWRSWNAWKRVGAVASVPAGFLAFTRWGLGFSDLSTALATRASVLEYPLSQLSLHLTYYLRNVVWPFPMRPLPDLEPAAGLVEPGVLAGGAVVVASLALAWKLRQKAPVIAFSIPAYWVLLAPTSSVLPLWQLTAPYRPFPGLPFLLLLLVLGGARALRSRPRAARALVAVSVVYLAGAGIFQNRVWATEQSLWERNVRLGGDASAHFFYANSLRGTDEEGATRHFQEALRKNPDHLGARINLGFHLMDLGRTEEGLAQVREAARRGPNRPMTHYWLSVALDRAGYPAEAARESGRASDLDPRNLRWAHKAALDAQRAGQDQEALRFLERVEAVDAGYQNTPFVRGFSLQRLGRLDEAAAAYRDHLAANPEHVQAHFNLGHAFMEMERCRDAIRSFERVLELDPEYVEAHLHMARCHKSLGQDDEAARHAAAWARAGEEEQ